MTQHAEKCPVCEGKTTMPASFYDDLSRDCLVECRSCKGKGYLLIGMPDWGYPQWQPYPSWTYRGPEVAPLTFGETTAAPLQITHKIVTSDRSQS